jgi:cell division protein FtsQ
MSVESKNSSKFSWRKLGIGLTYLCFIAATFTLLAFSIGHQGQLKCWKMQIEVKGDEAGRGLITEEEIMQICNEANKGVLGKTAAQIDIPNLRRSLLIQPYIKQAQVYPMLDGRCKIQIETRTPIARVLDSAGTSSYLDVDGYVMPLKDGFSADVPLFVGAFRAPMLTQSIDQDKKATQHQKDIWEMAKIIVQNETWDAQVDHMNWSERYGWVMTPRVGRNVIRMDGPAHFKRKMENLFVFYSKVMPHVDLDGYDTLDARFINQIVGIKRNIAL